MKLCNSTRALILFVLLVLSCVAARAQGVTVIKAGRLVDPEAGTAATNQMIVVEGRRIKAVGSNLPIPAGANVIDLSGYAVLPGLSDAHTHLCESRSEEHTSE